MDLKKLSPQELLQLCLASKDEAPWLEFVTRFQPLIARVIMRCVRRRTFPQSGLVDDLVQDTFLKLCANQGRALRDFEYEHEHALFAFLKKVAQNVVQDYFRTSLSQKRGSGREQETLESAAAMAAASRASTDQGYRNVLLGQIARCIEDGAPDASSTRDATIFWLYYRHGLTAKAISHLPAIGLSVKGVESTLLRLTRMVRGKMNVGSTRRGIASGQ
jgi:RNA polymerase sigma-70 factor, ECF subfamily